MRQTLGTWRHHLSRAFRARAASLQHTATGKSSQCVYATQLTERYASLAQAPNNSRERGSVVLTQAGPTGFPALDAQAPGRGDPGRYLHAAATIGARSRRRAAPPRPPQPHTPERPSAGRRYRSYLARRRGLLHSGCPWRTSGLPGSQRPPRGRRATAIGLLGSAPRPQLPVPPEAYS